MESEEAILENENNFNVELESTLRDRDPQQADEELLEDQGSESPNPPVLSPAFQLQDESGITESGDTLNSPVHELSEELMAQGESSKNEEAAGTSTPVAKSREESILDYEDFVDNDDVSQTEGNGQFEVAESVRSSEKVPDVTSESELQKPMEADDNDLDAAETPAAGSSGQTGGIERVDIHENVGSSIQHLHSDDEEKDCEQREKSTIEYVASKEADSLATDQSETSKDMRPASTDSFGDLIENLEISARGEASTVKAEMLMDKTIVPVLSKHDNTVKEVLKEAESPFYVEDNVVSNIFSEKSWRLPPNLINSKQVLSESTNTSSPPDTVSGEDLKGEDPSNKIEEDPIEENPSNKNEEDPLHENEEDPLHENEEDPSNKNEDRNEDVTGVNSSNQNMKDAAEEVDSSHQDKDTHQRGVVYEGVHMDKEVTKVNSASQDTGRNVQGVGETILHQQSHSSDEKCTNDSVVSDNNLSETGAPSNPKLVDARMPKSYFGVTLEGEHVAKEADSEADGSRREDTRSNSPGSRGLEADVMEDSVDNTSPRSSTDCENQLGTHIDQSLHLTRSLNRTPELMDVDESTIDNSDVAPEIDAAEASSPSAAIGSPERTNSKDKVDIDESTIDSSDLAPMIGVVEAKSPPTVADSLKRNNTKDKGIVSSNTGANSDSIVSPLTQSTSSTLLEQDTSATQQVQGTSSAHLVPNTSPTRLVPDADTNAELKEDVDLIPKTEVHSGKSVKKGAVQKSVAQPTVEEDPPVIYKRPQRARRTGNKVEEKAAATITKNETVETKLNENGLKAQNSALNSKQELLEDEEKSTITLASPETQQTESRRSKSSRSKTHTCLVCQKICKCKYNIERDGDVKHLCDDPCFKQFKKTPSTFLKGPDNSKPSKKPSKTSEPSPLVPVQDSEGDSNNSKPSRKPLKSSELTPPAPVKDPTEGPNTRPSRKPLKTPELPSLAPVKDPTEGPNNTRPSRKPLKISEPTPPAPVKDPAEGPNNTRPSRKPLRTPEPPPPVPVKDPVAISHPQIEMESRQNATYKTCAVCQLLNLNASQPFCNWKGLDFCGEPCLEKFQANLNSVCSFCHASIPVELRPGCCMKIGADMHLFCKLKCCNEFKKKLRLCAFCQRDVAGILGAFSGIVGKAGKSKEFCSQACMRKLEARMKEFDLILVEKGSLMNCSTCGNNKPIKFNVWLKGKLHTLCSDLCLSACKYANHISTDACDHCGTVCSLEEAQAHFVQYMGQLKQFCSDACVSQFCKVHSRVEACGWCNVKKMNFDMIGRQDAENKFVMFCSLNCLALCQAKAPSNTGLPVACDQCKKVEPAQYHLTMSDASIRNYCSYSCVLLATNRKSPGVGSLSLPTPALRHHQPHQLAAHTQQQMTPPGAIPGQGFGRGQINTRQVTRQLSKSVPVISSVVSLASSGDQQPQRPQQNLRSTPIPPHSVPPQSTAQNAAPSHPVPSQSTFPPPPASSQVPPPHVTTSPGVTKTATGNMVPSADGKHQILIQSPPPKVGKNRSLQCKPMMQTKATSCKPHSQTKETQTDEFPKTVFVPVPTPVYVPMPTVMFTAPAMKLVPFPIPIPVPIFIPTTRKSVNGILKAIQDILERIPADPLEAEILMMAEAVAADGRPGDSDTDSEADALAEDFGSAVDEEVVRPVSRDDDALLLRKRERQGEEDMIQMALRMAEEMSGPIEDLETSVEPVAVSSEAPPQQIQYDSPAEDDYIPPRPAPRATKRVNRGKPPASRVKKPRIGRAYDDDASIQSQPSMQTQSMEPPPDANYRLKFTYGVNAWRHWISNKNADIEKAKQVTGNYKLRNFPSDLLRCTADDLNNTLCMFIKEVRKPNGDEYSPDSIYYLCLGIQQYLFENGRIENIFTDIYFEKFTDRLNDILKTLRPKINSQGQMLCRIEEEHLWESKQLGAHSPFILLNTLIYFHTKHFILKTASEHMCLSFAQILKHWKKGMPLKGQSAASGKNVSLRFYCLANGKKDGLAARKNKDGQSVYEVTENLDNPLRCPVKLYEFFLSKCPESIKNRNDIFYPVPERSCVPDSPVWYSTQSIDVHTMDKMLTRVLLVREIQEAHLHAQPIYM